MNDWNRGIFFQGIRDGRIAKVARRHDEAIEASRVLALVGADRDVPPLTMPLGTRDSCLEPQLEVGMAGEVLCRIALEVLADHPRLGQLRDRVAPGQVAKVHRVPALVRQHERVNLAARIVLGRRPETADVVLRVKDGDLELSPAGRVVQQRLGDGQTGRPRA